MDAPRTATPNSTAAGQNHAEPHPPLEQRMTPVNWFTGLMAAFVLVAAGFLGGTMFALNEESSTTMRLAVVAVAILAPISMLVWLLLRMRPKVRSHGRR